MNFWRIREFNRSIYNLFYYFKTIWNDRDWDHSYIEALQLKKLEKAYKYRTTSEYYMSSVDDDIENQALRICIEILKRRRKDWYCNVWDAHHGKYLDMNFLPAEGNLSELKITEREGINENYNPGGYHDLVEERDWKVYNKLIERHQRRWWD